MLYGELNVSKRPEVRKKISDAMKGRPSWNKGGTMTPEWKAKIGKANRGFKKCFEISCEVCKIPVIASVKHPRRFCSRTCFGKASQGTNHPRWIADRSTLVQKQERNDSAYREWRKQVWLRDNFKCKIANPDCKGRIEAHHILVWSKYPELRYQTNNGITLCHFHHPRKRSEEERLVSIFNELVLATAK